ncbi:MAG TPA: glycoside hydrolase family 3 C-terminal domain-containing protein [Candidatus Angelobacter sp.]|nr:glycoside hydrolase family 3 C-terminal domain-containing protein [Candidatus Angelobacter sp.]
MKPQLLALCLIIGAPVFGAETDRPPYLDPGQSIETRVEDLLSRLTLQEKGSLVYANSTFSVAGVPRLGIPDLWMDDGPMGVREEVGVGFRNLNRTDDFATAMPATLGLAATFDTNLAREYGAVIGQEARQRGKNIMLGPSVCIQRTPLCGRNFEYMGEDPFLTSRMAVNYIAGEQAQGVGSCVKHFAANNQEYQRGSIDVEMDERTLREIYLPAFHAAVQEAGVLAVMGAYNKFRGQHCCENDYLLNTVLKGQWGFKGLVMSDWSGVHDTGEAALNGMDMEMGTRTSPPFDTAYLAKPFLEGIESRKYPVSVLDDKVRRHLYVMFRLNLIHDPAETNTQPATFNSQLLSRPEHQAISREVAEESIVLLKNKGLLPLDSSKLKSIAVIGANAVAKFASGGGSANIKAPYEITALEGISNRLGSGVTITYSPGYSNPAFRGWNRGSSGSPLSINTNLFAAAIEAARAADVVIFIGGLNHSLDREGSDRRDLKLPGGQDELLRQIVRANPKTVVVFNGGGAVEMDEAWLSRVPSLVYAWYGGMEGGNALSRVLFGDVDPSGKLPCTFPKRLADSPAHALHSYPGTNGTETYKEGLLVGYRWFDTKKIQPLFPFGYGLSYTTFKYSRLELAPDRNVKNPAVTVEFTLANTGKRAGAEVAQVYVRELHPGALRPFKELKGFARVSLESGEKRKISIRLNQNAFAHYDPGQGGWVADKGDYKIMVGGSSREIALQGNYRLAAPTFEGD